MFDLNRYLGQKREEKEMYKAQYLYKKYH